jgi:DNA helicase II / ATP-dependent DNA helicase PcrA
VNLLTYHRAKGLEFDAVFLPRLVEGELPFRRVSRPEGLAEERRLLYVGVTRARRHLFMTWSVGGSARSSFLDPLVDERSERDGGSRPEGGRKPKVAAEDDAAVVALKSWRLERARRDAVPPYVVLHDRTVEEIASRRPRTLSDLATISGIGPTKLERYGAEILETLGDGALHLRVQRR